MSVSANINSPTNDSTPDRADPRTSSEETMTHSFTVIISVAQLIAVLSQNGALTPASAYSAEIVIPYVLNHKAISDSNLFKPIKTPTCYVENLFENHQNKMTFKVMYKIKIRPRY